MHRDGENQHVYIYWNKVLVPLVLVLHAAVPGRNIISLPISTALPCSKCCSAELLLRAGLICCT